MKCNTLLNQLFYTPFVTDWFLTFLATIDELSSVDSLSSNEKLCPLLESVWITEDHFGQGSTTTRVVNDVLRVYNTLNISSNRKTSQDQKESSPYLHNTLDVAMAFSKVNVTEFSRTFAVLDVGPEHGACTFSLSPDHTSHRVLRQKFTLGNSVNIKLNGSLTVNIQYILPAATLKLNIKT